MKIPDNKKILYYNDKYYEMGTKEIRDLHDGDISEYKITQFKEKARNMTKEHNAKLDPSDDRYIRTASPHNVNTKMLLKACGYNVSEIRKIVNAAVS